MSPEQVIPLVAIGVVLGALMAFFTRRSTNTATEFRMPKQVEITQDVELLAEVKALLRLRSKIEAIKVYREKTGVDLKSAKEAVEFIEKTMTFR